MLCTISGEFRTPNGQLQPGAVVKFKRSAGVHSYVDTGGPVTVVPDEVVMTVNASGVGTVSLYPGRYQVELLGSNGQEYVFRVNVPTEASILFSALLAQAADFGDGGQVDAVAALAAQAFQSRQVAEASAAYVLGLEDEIEAAAAAGTAVPPLATQVGLDAAAATAAAATATTKAAEADASADAAAASAASAAAKDSSILRDRGDWFTGMILILGDWFSYDGEVYGTEVAHVATTIAADLAAGKIKKRVAKGASGAGVGNMLKAENLSGLTDVPLARVNLGLGSAATANASAFEPAGAVSTALAGAKADGPTALAGTNDSQFMTPLQNKAVLDARFAALGDSAWRYGWHPFDTVDPNTPTGGKLWIQSTDGNTAAINSPDLEDGYEHRVWMRSMSGTENSILRMNMLWSNGTIDVWGANLDLGNMLIGAASSFFLVELPFARSISSNHFVKSTRFTIQSTGVTNGGEVSCFQNSSAVSGSLGSNTKIKRFRFLLSAGSFDGGVVRMERRKVMYAE